MLKTMSLAPNDQEQKMSRLNRQQGQQELPSMVYIVCPRERNFLVLLLSMLTAPTPKVLVLDAKRKPGLAVNAPWVSIDVLIVVLSIQWKQYCKV